MKFAFTEAELREMAVQFIAIDTDLKDLLDETKLQGFLSESKVNPVFAKILFRLFDLDKDNALNFSEFALFLKGLDLLKTNPIEFHKFVFKSVDVDDNDRLQASELVLFFDLLGVSESIETMTSVIEKLTGGEDTSITFDQLYSGIIEPLSQATFKM